MYALSKIYVLPIVIIYANMLEVSNRLPSLSFFSMHLIYEYYSYPFILFIFVCSKLVYKKTMVKYYYVKETRVKLSHIHHMVAFRSTISLFQIVLKWYYLLHIVQLRTVSVLQCFVGVPSVESSLLLSRYQLAILRDNRHQCRRAVITPTLLSHLM